MTCYRSVERAERKSIKYMSKSSICMSYYGYIIKRWPLLALVAMIMIAPSFQSCRSKVSAIGSASRISLSGIVQPKVSKKSAELSVPTLALPALGIGQAIAKVDTANSIVIQMERQPDSSLVVRAFSFEPEPMAIGPIKVEAEASEESPPEPLPWSKLFLWSGVLMCVVVLARRK